MNGAKTFLDSSYLSNWFLRNRGLMKIWLLQCYALLWIHSIILVLPRAEACGQCSVLWKSKSKRMEIYDAFDFDSKFLSNKS